MKKTPLFLVLGILVVAAGFFVSLQRPLSTWFHSDANPKATIIAQGTIECYPRDTRDKDNAKLLAEPAGVVYHGDKLFFFNRKSFDFQRYNSLTRKSETISPVFSIPLETILNEPGRIRNELVTYHDHYNFFKVSEYEGSTLNIYDGSILALASLSRFDPIKKKWESTPQLISTTNMETQDVEFISHEKEVGFQSSESQFVEYMRDALKSAEYPQGPDHFKLSSITMSNQDEMLFAIESLCNEGYTPKKQVKLLKASTYYNTANKLVLRPKFKGMVNYTNLGTRVNAGAPLGLTSVEWNRVEGKLYFLTAYNKENTTSGGYLWTLSENDLGDSGKIFPVLNNEDRKPLHFKHKPISVTVLDAYEKKLLVLCSPSNNTTISDTKKVLRPNEALYYIVKLES